MRRTTVLVADSRPRGRARRRAALEESGLEVCAEVANAADAVGVAGRQAPDICLIDAHLDDVVAAAAGIKTRAPASRVVIVGGTANGQVLDALAAGASGYLVGRDPTRLAHVLERVRDGEVAIPRASPPSFPSTAAGVRVPVLPRSSPRGACSSLPANGKSSSSSASHTRRQRSRGGWP